MPKSYVLLSIAICGLLTFQSCTSKRPNGTSEKPVTQESLIEINKAKVDQEDQRIRKFIKRRGWKMQETGTGLRIFIYEHGPEEHPLARENQVAKVDVEVSLLDGTIVYSTRESGPQEFLIGMDDVESGLHEGILYMRVGDRAKMILPPHLAHGLSGDRNAIPGDASIVYDVHLLDLQ